MNNVKPLFYLAYKTFFNGVRRALTTPRRLITLIIFIGYYFFLFIRPAFAPTKAGDLPRELFGKIAFPATQIIDAVSFTLFTFLSLMLLMSILSYQASFKPADVDVLFSTPIPPRIVLLFRMMRDYFITLLIPFFFAILGLRPAKLGWETLFANMPPGTNPAMALRAMTLSWVLMAMCWVTLSYGASLWVNRSDLQSDRNKRMLGWTLGLVVCAVVGYIGYELTKVTSFADAIALADQPFLRTFFFTATFATMLTMGALTGSFMEALGGAAGLIGIIWVGFWLAMRQVGWMYDQAAVKAQKTAKARDLQRSGDVMAYMAEQARSGKVKVKGMAWLRRARWKGPHALIWKELLLQRRGMFGMVVAFSFFGIGLSVIPALTPMRSGDMSAPIFFLMMQGSTLLMVTLSLAQTGFIELLRRVDLQKPLPFSASTIVFYEMVAKAVLGVLACFLGGVVASVIRPQLFPYALGSTVFAIFISLLLCACVLFVTLLFPDIDDPSQRQFRGLVTILSFAVCSLLPFVIFAALLGLKMYPALAALIAGSLALGITAVLAALSGRLYAGFNPNE